MSAVDRLRAVAVACLVALCIGATAGCSGEPVQPVTAEAWVPGDGPPPYCSPSTAADADFWTIVHASCVIAQDGDVAQAEALRHLLDSYGTGRIERFHRSLVRLNHELAVASDVADDLCAPGLGLGDDLGTDYRSWVIAHGQSAYDAVLADPDVLRDFPDAELGCGLGEPFGAAALDLYLDRTGQGLDEAGLPLLAG
ncbi:DUF4240 domain-containing protein [Nocardioides sp. zg-1228]|uniref:DUF4240 domain-containing protein n=1 Tax=Nocardioides sp. zg-1228 TaxID=2763008 RepID=UPI0016434370|nr:DUF4240 domain-containing protein [Nocardioides sp. zg-1228]MBC2933860.1 DUF4240 domain-containing protein [Nocardioides sp. zg-1228]QSF58628.1 DUF4240 domain-containing protein [Nocardioides sp. zg-1228]